MSQNVAVNTEGAQPFVIDFKEAFGRFIASHEKEWAHDRKLTLGASEAFNCMRQLVATKRGDEFGVEPDPDYEETWGATHRGNMVENFFVAPALQQQLPAIGLTLEFAGDEQQTLVDGRNSVTPDGLIFDVPVGPVVIKAGDRQILLPNVTTGVIGLEIKSIDPRATLDEERSKHYGQVQIGMGIVNTCTEHEVHYWVILYIDASFMDNITPFVIEYDPSIYQAAKARATQVWGFKKFSDAPAEGKLEGACDYCKFRKACGEAIVSRWKEAENDQYNAIDIEAIRPHVVELDNLRKRAEEAAAALDDAKQEFKDFLHMRRINKMNEEDFTFNWRTQRGKVTKSIPKLVAKIEELAAKLTAAGVETTVDMSEFESTGADFDVLTFKLKDNEDPKPRKVRKVKGA